MVEIDVTTLPDHLGTDAKESLPHSSLDESSEWEFDPDEEILVQKLSDLGLHTPPEINTEILDDLEVGDLRCIARVMKRCAEDNENPPVDPAVRKVNSLSFVNPLTNEKQEDPRVEEMRQKLKETYDGVLLGTEVIPDPPKRGPYAKANISVIEGQCLHARDPL